MQELLLDFAAWIDLTSNGDTSITSIVSVDIRAHSGSLKRAGDLRVYQGLMMPLNHQAGRHARYFKRALKCIVYISLLFDYIISSCARSISRVVLNVTIADENYLCSRSPSYCLFSFDLREDN